MPNVWATHHMYDLRTHTFTTPGGHPQTMTYREDTNDWNTLTSCLTEDEYGLPQGLTGVALDIGGHIGSVAIALALDNSECRVMVVEPIPDNIELIRTNIEQNNVWDQVHLIEGAVGKGTVEVAYGYSDTEVGRHHAFIGNLSMVGDETPGAVVSYEATTLWTLVALAGGAVEWMKIDTEGAEYDFLDDSAVGGVKTIVGEWHHGRMVDLIRLLIPTHEVTASGTPADAVGSFHAERL